MNPLRRLYDSTATFLVLTRPLAPADAARTPSLTQQDRRDLCRFCDARGFGQGWAAHTLTLGDAVQVVRDPGSGEVIAGGWLADRDFWVFEIGYTFRPADGGIYLHGAFVAESHRGQHLQRRLIRDRIALAARLGHRFAHTIIWDGNTASRKNCEAEGFKIAARLTGLRVGPWQRDHLDRCHASLPPGQLLDASGTPIPAAIWRRRYQPLRAPIASAA